MTALPQEQGAALFEKRYPSAARAETALRRSLSARIAGVPTPAVWQGNDPTRLFFERIDAGAAPSLAQMTGVVRRLRRMATDGLSRFDPFLRIRPRLMAAPPDICQLFADLEARDAALGWPALTVIHGDFHPGQCLQDRTGKVWLIDLDDLALGPHEADLGNLAAWIATSVKGPMGEQTRRALDQVLAVSPMADPALTGHFCQIALLRRALKLAGKGLPWALVQLPSKA